MYTFITVVVTVLVLIFVVKDVYSAIQDKKNTLENDYKRWSDNELYVAGYVAVFVEDEVRLNDVFQTQLATVLSRSERAVNEKIRRLSTVGSAKSDASVADEDIVLNIAQLPDSEDPKEIFEISLELIGASTRQQQSLLQWL